MPSLGSAARETDGEPRGVRDGRLVIEQALFFGFFPTEPRDSTDTLMVALEFVPEGELTVVGWVKPTKAKPW